MSDMEPKGGEKPPQDQASVPAGDEQSQRQPLDIQTIAGMNDEQEIGALLFADQAPSPPSAPAAPAASATPETPPAGETESPPPADEQSQADDDVPNPPQDAKANSLERMSLKALHPDDRQLLVNAKEMVREGKAASIAAAVIALTQPQESSTQQPTPQPDAQAASQTETPAPVEQSPALVQLTAQLADLREQRKAAVAEYDRETETELTSQIEDTRTLIAEEKSTQVALQREAAVQQSQLNAVIEDIYVEHPESEDPKSFFRFRLNQEVEEYEQAHGDIARRPQQLKALAAKVAGEISGTPAKAAAAVIPKQPVARQQAQPIGTAAPGSAAVARSSPDQIQKIIESADAETLHAALFG